MAPLLDEVARRLITADPDGLVVATSQPDLALFAGLSKSESRFVLALDDPPDVAAEMVERSGADAPAVARTIANSCALLMNHRTLPGALTLHAAAARADPGGTVILIAEHFGIASGGEDARIADELAAASITPGQPVEDAASRIPEDSRRTINGAISGYRQCFAGRDVGRLVWHNELFSCTAADGWIDGHIVDLAGSARVLTFGPYIHLPIGAWSAQVYLGASPEAVGRRLLIEVYDGKGLAATDFQPGTAGVFVVDVAFILDDRHQKPLEIRVIQPDDGAQGRLAFGQVVLQPGRAARGPEVIGRWDDLASVLET